ncbi:MAG: SPASM domain-containing protein, partial [bacterium]
VYCYGGMDGCFVLGADGKLWKCTVGLDDRNQVGYLTEEGEIVFRKQGLDDWDRYSEEWLSDQSCLSCLFLPLCMGGCILSRRNGRRVCYYRRGPIEKLMEIYFRLCMKGGD